MHDVPEITYVNRETSKLEVEKVYGESELMFLYNSSLGVMLRKTLVRKPVFSHIYGIPKHSWFSKKQIEPFIEMYEVDSDEAEKPTDSYRSLDAFFSRKLRADARPINQNTCSLVSPADGRLLAYDLNDDTSFFIKGHEVKLDQLIGASQITADLKGGKALVIRLAPKDYHRFHFPCGGRVISSYKIPGLLESVHPIALSAGAKSFANKRQVTLIRSDSFGEIYMVEIGALTIGTIVQNDVSDNVRKAQEKGYFRFGGSTVALFWGKEGPAIDVDLIENSKNGIETLVRMGSQVASLDA